MNHLFFQARLPATMPPSVHLFDLQAVAAASIRYFQNQCCSLAAAEQIKYATTVFLSHYQSVISTHRRGDKQQNNHQYIHPDICSSEKRSQRC